METAGGCRHMLLTCLLPAQGKAEPKRVAAGLESKSQGARQQGQLVELSPVLCRCLAGQVGGAWWHIGPGQSVPAFKYTHKLGQF